jgi:hypothetical protein
MRWRDAAMIKRVTVNRTVWSCKVQINNEIKQLYSIMNFKTNAKPSLTCVNSISGRSGAATLF